MAAPGHGAGMFDSEPPRHEQHGSLYDDGGYVTSRHSRAPTGWSSDTFEPNQFSSPRVAPPSALDEVLGRPPPVRSSEMGLVDRRGAYSSSNYLGNPSWDDGGGGFSSGGHTGKGLSDNYDGFTSRPLRDEFPDRGFSFTLDEPSQGNATAGYRASLRSFPEGRGWSGLYLPEEQKWNPSRQRWNPLDVKRGWGEPQQCAVDLPRTSMVQAPGWMQSFDVHQPTALETELRRTEGRAQALRMKLSSLESDLVTGIPFHLEGQTKVVVPYVAAGNRLGVTLQGTVVARIDDPRAEQFGWAVGDQVLKVNGFEVTSTYDFTEELRRAMGTNSTTGKPMVFDVYRPPRPVVSELAGRRYPTEMGGRPQAYQNQRHVPMGSGSPRPIGQAWRG